MEATSRQCAHPACKCSVVEGKRFCSPHCEQHAQGDDVERVMCGCGHPACGGTEAAA